MMTDNGLPYLFGLLYNVPDDGGATCASWQAGRLAGWQMGNATVYGVDAMIENMKRQDMATTPKKQATMPAVKPEAKMLPRKGLNLERGKTEAQTHRNHAALLVSPEVAAFQVLRSVDSAGGFAALWDQLDIPSLTDELRAQAAAVNRGEMVHVEAMLMNQATALQGIFGRLVERGMNSEHMPAFEGNMRMALRAQNQCRTTLETLATIKNPPVIFARQANINHGNQQVNNGTALPMPRTEEIKNEPNQLLEADHGKTLDTRATSSTGGKDQAMATLDA